VVGQEPEAIAFTMGEVATYYITTAATTRGKAITNKNEQPVSQGWE